MGLAKGVAFGVVGAIAGVGMLCAVATAGGQGDERGGSYLRPRGDSGPAPLISQVKEVLPRLLADDVAVGRLPADLDGRAAAVGSEAGRRSRRDAIDRVWVAEQADRRFSDLERALELVAADPDYRAFDDNRFTVRRWEGVTVRGDEAFALVVGHQAYRLGAKAWHVDPDEQYQVRLRRGPAPEGGGWQLIDKIAVATSDGDSGR